MRVSVLLLTLAISPVFAANLVVNGTFDSNCANWSFGGFTNFCDTTTGNPGSALVVNDAPGVVPFATQVISGLTTGLAYTISLDAKTWFNCCNSPTVPGAGVNIDGHQFNFLVVNNQPWTHYSFVFTYDGGANTLKLSSQLNGTDSDAEFDNVAITAGVAAVPEPGTVLLCCGALLAFLRRRR
jgi:hypothetical protein